ncbi:MAG: Ezrin/radixin/moesin family protein [Bacteroidota bacterium]|nr:Ezrin/radixin/moesin family protein [Bacteroidota bacterium]
MILRSKIAILSILFSLFCLSVFAQADEAATRKEWEKKKKEMDALEFKKVYDENETLKGELAAKRNSATDLENQVAQKSEELRKLQEEFDNYKRSMNTATTPERNTTDATNIPEDKKVRMYKGVVFKVQIGAFKNKDLRKYFENNPNFSGDVDPDGLKKYTIGYFNDYWEAETFKKYLREMGVKDAWIVPYKNGQRVNIRDVLEGIL